MLIVSLVFTVLWGNLTARIARGRGRRPALWAALGAFFGVFAVGTVALLPRKTVESKQPATA